MWAKKSIGMFAGALLCGMISVLNASAVYNNWVVEYEKIPQQRTNWCWAASAADSKLDRHCYY